MIAGQPEILNDPLRPEPRACGPDAVLLNPAAFLMEIPILIGDKLWLDLESLGEALLAVEQSTLPDRDLRAFFLFNTYSHETQNYCHRRHFPRDH